MANLTVLQDPRLRQQNAMANLLPNLVMAKIQHNWAMDVADKKIAAEKLRLDEQRTNEQGVAKTKAKTAQRQTILKGQVEGDIRPATGSVFNQEQGAFFGPDQRMWKNVPAQPKYPRTAISNFIQNNPGASDYDVAQYHKSLQSQQGGYTLGRGQTRYGQNNQPVAVGPPIPEGQGGYTLGPGQTRYGSSGEVLSVGPPKTGGQQLETVIINGKPKTFRNNDPALDKALASGAVDRVVGRTPGDVQKMKVQAELKQIQAVSETGFQLANKIEGIARKNKSILGMVGGIQTFIDTAKNQVLETAKIFGGGAEINGRTVKERTLLNPALYDIKLPRGIGEAAADRAAFKSTVTTLAFIRARSLNPDGRISDMDVRQALKSFGADSGSWNQFESAVLSFKEDLYTQYVANHKAVHGVDSQVPADMFSYQPPQGEVLPQGVPEGSTSAGKTVNGLTIFRLPNGKEMVWEPN